MEIVFSSIIISVIVFISVVIIFFYRKKISEFSRQNHEFHKLKVEYVEKINILNNEINRQNLVMQTYQSQLFGKRDSLQENYLQFTEQSDEKITEKNLGVLTQEVDKLEIEKKKFAEKNKKLWEQSLSIHKEKERIDILKKEIETEHKNVTDSIKYAKRIQTALMPIDESFEQIFEEYFIYWQPLNIVSGDFYWLRKIENHIYFIVADCTGHGVPGAFMSALGVAFLNEIINKNKNILANQILEELRILVKSTLNTQNKQTTKDGMDLALCVIDKESRKMSFSGANNPLYIIRNQELIEFKPTKNPIGHFIVEKPFESIDFQLEKDDVCYLFSDGITDNFGGENGRKFTRKKLQDLLIKINQENLDLKSQKERIENVVKLWLGDNYKQIDDILIVGFKF